MSEMLIRSPRARRCHGCGLWIAPGTLHYAGGLTAPGYVECQSCHDYYEHLTAQAVESFDLDDTLALALGY